MAKRPPSSKQPSTARGKASARRAPARPKSTVAPGSRRMPPTDDALPSLADLKRARARLDAAIAALERKPRR